MFKISDKVRVKESLMTSKFEGMVGIVILIDEEVHLGVDFGVDFKGHDLNGEIKSETGWYMLRSELELVKKSNREVY